MNKVDYIGRFAPSPTGPLHIGSLVAALGSYLDARQQRGRWLLRIEDLDPPRTVVGAVDSIRYDLEAHSLHWDGPVCMQSNRSAVYASAIGQLACSGHTFYCLCSRSAIGPGRYPGTCRQRTHPTAAGAIRLLVPDGPRPAALPLDADDVAVGGLSAPLEEEVRAAEAELHLEGRGPAEHGAPRRRSWEDRGEHGGHARVQRL